MSKPLHPYDQTAVLEHTRGNRFAEEISVYAAKRRRRRQPETVETIGPTPERLAKVESYEEILVPVRDAETRATSRVTQVRTVFESVSGRLTEEDVQAISRWVQRNYERQQGRSMISSYGDGGGVAYGPRHGGVPDSARLADAECKLLATHMGSEVWQVFEVLTSEITGNRGESYSPWCDKANRRIFLAGMLKVIAMFIRWHERREQALGGRQESTQTEILARRQARMEREARGRGR